MNLENQPTRVKYQERQVLRTRDLTDEQAYHLEMRRRHNLALHTWGIAHGLGLKVSDTGNEVSVEPGVAIDWFGRELVLPGAVRITDPGSPLETGSYDVFLRYNLTTLPNHPNRVIERATVVRQPTAERKQLLYEFEPHRVPPDGVTDEWPVLLGRIAWQAPEGKPGEPACWQIDMFERRYAGLVAERIVSRRMLAESDERADKRTIIQNGNPGRSPYPFAVYLAEGLNPDEADPVLAVDDARNVVLNTPRISLGGDLVLRDGAALDFLPNKILSEGTDKRRDQGAPWRIYRFFRPAAGGEEAATAPPTPAASATAPTPADARVDELRICMADSPRGATQVVIGRWSDKGEFKPVLTVAADGSVKVDGNLVVTGTVSGRFVKGPGTAASDSLPTPDNGLLGQVNEFVGADPGKLDDVLKVLLNTPVRQDLVAKALLDRGSQVGPKFLDAITRPGAGLQPTALAEAAVAAAPGELVGQLFRDSSQVSLAKFVKAFAQNAGSDPGSPVAVFVNYLRGHKSEPDVKDLITALRQGLPEEAPASR